MITLHVPDMSCAHCTGVITKALKALDPAAVIGYDMHHHQVQIDTQESLGKVLQVMEQAGYPSAVAP